MQPITHRFFSVSAFSRKGSRIEDLELNIQTYGQDVVRMILTNRLHGEQCLTHVKKLLMITIIATLYFSIAWRYSETPIEIQQSHILFPALIFFALVSVIVRAILDLVHSEKLFYSWDMALQTEIIYTFGRKTVVCVQRGHLHDMVLNEVVENLEVKYMLIIRTTGSAFNERPIIPLFNSLSPSFECLQFVQRTLHDYWVKNKMVKKVLDYQGNEILEPPKSALDYLRGDEATAS